MEILALVTGNPGLECKLSDGIVIYGLPSWLPEKSTFDVGERGFSLKSRFLDTVRTSRIIDSFRAEFPRESLIFKISQKSEAFMTILLKLRQKREKDLLSKKVF